MEKPSVIFIQEPLGISSVTGKSLKKIKQSAIPDHLLQCNCRINFDHFDVLAADSNKFKLIQRESLLLSSNYPQRGNLLIKRDRLILNRTMKSFLLELFD